MTRNNDIETLLRKALEGHEDDHQEPNDDYQPRNTSRAAIPLNDDDALTAIVLDAVNHRSNTL